MDVLSFFGGVWASIIIGCFFIAMVIGCSLDRDFNESPKWWVFVVGILVFLLWKWDDLHLSWNTVVNSTYWEYLGFYLLIGLGYSILEFLLAIRRSVRYWENTWTTFKSKWTKEGMLSLAPYEQEAYLNLPENERQKFIVEKFILKYSTMRYGKKNIITIKESDDGNRVEPTVNRSELAESVGVWTIFWPFYAVSLLIGNFLTEIFRIIADVLANLSGRMVKLAFKDVFK